MRVGVLLAWGSLASHPPVVHRPSTASSTGLSSACPPVIDRPARAYNNIEARFARLCELEGIEYDWQFRLGRFVYDFRLPGRVLVEVHGGWYHADPRRHLPDALTPAQQRTIVHDLRKRLHAAERGWRLKVVWEQDPARPGVTVRALLGESGDD